ncbi:MAG: folate-binding protein YgfZ [Hyphomicrobium sp.]|nr:folate-binding protein YgfZ [Hyphomicrobium sp.]
MASDTIAPLPNRSVISVTGADAAKFLQGLITNDVETLTKDGSALHAALLSPQGKILFDFFVIRTAAGILIDISRDTAADFVKRLSLYKLRANIVITDRTNDYKVFAIWGAALPDEALSPFMYTDPRLAALGLRVLADEALVKTLNETPRLVVVDEAAYDAHRIRLGVPEGGKDFVFGDAYPHDACFDIFHGVSFTKGCFVGQEVVARMENKSVVRKRVVKIEGDAPLAGQSDIILSDAPIGRVGSVSGYEGLAMVRLDRASDALDKPAPLVANGVVVTVAPDAVAAYRKAAAAKNASSGPI